MTLKDTIENKVNCKYCKVKKCKFSVSMYIENNIITGGMYCPVYNVGSIEEMKVSNQTQEDMDRFRQKMIDSWNNFIKNSLVPFKKL